MTICVCVCVVCVCVCVDINTPVDNTGAHNHIRGCARFIVILIFVRISTRDLWIEDVLNSCLTGDNWR
jgi:hypothetical protein